MTKYGRHAPAFVLLFLAKEPAYGLELLRKMEEEMPFSRMDSAVIYRTLNKLEKDGDVESYWDTSETGPARKWYKITPKGREKLGDYKEDIECRKQNFDYFLKTYRLINDIEEKYDGKRGNKNGE